MIEFSEKQEIEKVLRTCHRSLKTFAKTFFPERFTLPFSSVIHDPIFRILDDPTIQEFVICAPRGCGKTSIVQLAYLAHQILFREAKFIVPVSASQPHAIMQSENLKRELLTNVMVRKLFGAMKKPRARELEMFSKEEWLTETGTLVFPRGGDQQIRGFIFGHNRPDRIIIDDWEKSDTVLSEEQREKLKRRFWSDFYLAVDRHKNDWRIGIIGTMLHERSLIAELLEDKSWAGVRLELCDDDGNSNWPEHMSDKKIKALINKYRRQNLLDLFYREYRGLLIAGEGAVFSEDFFNYYEETDFDLNNNPNIDNVVILDPAKSLRIHSAETSIGGIGVNTMTNAIYFRDSVARKMYPDEIYDETFGMIDRINAKILGVEVTSLGEFITYPLRNEILKRQSRVKLVELHPRASKNERMAALAPFYRMGHIFHNRAVCEALEAQVLSFPHAKRNDVHDGFAYIIQLLDEGSRYFSFQGDDKQDSREVVEKEFEQLYKEYEKDKKVECNWRMI